ncbi:MAG: carbamoyl-phosphate synthase large subunit, partial [Opitutaceae bacterium]
AQIEDIVRQEQALAGCKLEGLDAAALRRLKRAGFSDRRLAKLLLVDQGEVRARRHALGVRPVYKRVDTCAAEFEAFTPYYYSSYGDENEVMPGGKKRKIMILGGGPNRIGQGIEFDYCCVHASFALREIGFETVMVNSNPETVSTDYDTSDRLYFEPLTLEDVLEIYQQEGCDGVIVQFGGQTPLNLATALKANGVNIIGTSPESIEAAEDRKLFAKILDKVGLRQPANRTAMNEADALTAARELGFPVLLRPSFVLGGRGMFIVYSEEEFRGVVRQAFEVMPDKPVLIDDFLEDAIELDVDCISDGETSVIGGMLEHIEFAGVHSGDAAMVMPPHTLSPAMLETVRKATHALARELKVIGLMNVQFAIKDQQLYVLEVNPRASRTVPFVAKAIGVPMAKLAAKVMTGLKLKDLGFTREHTPRHWCVKEAVFPFVRFPGATIVLGPEMRSTGEVMGLDEDLGVAFAKAQAAAKPGLPTSGNVFLSVKDADKPRAVALARQLEELGFSLYSTGGTAKVLAEAGLKVAKLAKIEEGRPTAVDLIKNGQIQLVINTPAGMIPRKDENKIRSAAYAHSVCIMTTLTGAQAAVEGIKALRSKRVGVKPIQQYRGNVTLV